MLATISETTEFPATGLACSGGDRAASILLVDDNPATLRFVGETLTRFHFRVETAGSGPEALRKAADLDPDVILLDVIMPGMDGFEVCRRLRATPDLAEIPIVLVTALDDRQSRLRALELGADDLISKPFDPIELRIRITNITRLNRYRKLTLERRKVEQLVALSPDGILVIDEDGVIRLANPAVVAMLGTANEEALLNGSLWGYLDPAGRRFCQRHLDERDDAPTTLECQLRRSDGSSFSGELAAAYCPWDLSPALQILVRDATERKRLEEEALHASRLEAIGRSARAIAHDFKSYLAAARIYAELLIGGIDPDDPLHKDATAIDRIVKDARNMVDGLLTFARGQDLDLRSLELRSVIMDLEPTLRTLVTSDRKLHLEVSENPLPIRADESLLRQVIVNLVANAREATLRGATITVRVSAEDLGCRRDPETRSGEAGTYSSVTVEDTGCGMGPTVRARMFEPFFSTKDRGGGVGLGLSIVYGAVRQLGGFLRVESKPGAGTTVRVLLPQPERSLFAGRSLTRPSQNPTCTA